MALPEGKCPHCGSPASNVRMHNEQSLVSSVDGEVHGAQRQFVGECPTHGTVFAVHKMGHHSTVGSSQLRQRYSSTEQKLIVERLPPEDRKAFKMTMRGHRRPVGGDLDRWDGLITKRLVINGWKAPTISDNGNSMLLRVRTKEGERFELVFGHDMLPRFVDWGTSGWNVSSQRMGRDPGERLTFELRGIVVGEIIASAENDCTIAITMRFGEQGSISYTVDEGLTRSLVQALTQQLNAKK